MRPLNPYAPEWRPASLSGHHAIEAKAADDRLTECSFNLADLPSEVITCTVSYLTSPSDLASCICSCKLLKRHAYEAELCLDMRGLKSMRDSANGGNMKDNIVSRFEVIQKICKYMQGTLALILPSLPLEDSDIEFLTARLPRLQLLDISGGRKITPASAATLAHLQPSTTPSGRLSPSSPCPSRSFPSRPKSENSPLESLLTPADPTKAQEPQLPQLQPHPSVPPPCPHPVWRTQSIRILNLQRCFQLHSGSLQQLLAAPGLGCLALSHLDLGRWAANLAGVGAALEGDTALVGGAPAPACPDPTEGVSGLKALALHNCLRLHGPAITALAAALGARPFPAPSGGGSVAFLLLGGSTLALASFVSGGASPSSPALPPRVSEVLVTAYKPAATATAATTQAHQAAARYLIAAALALPNLLALELTFFPPPLVHCVRRVLSDADVIGRRPVAVWDFAADAAADVQSARTALHRWLRVVRPPRRPSAMQGRRGAFLGADADATDNDGDGDDGHFGLSDRSCRTLDELAAATLLRCAVNCSSVTRSTPLHVASERGSLAAVVELLGAGAVADARDTSGNTPLFLAAEAGHTGVVERLLGAGADPRQGNAAGETPLYISALRGHLGCVQALLAHCQARGLDWQDPELYGDAWTPLHAAAVADRADVAACLLQAAGAAGAGDLVLAPNKYGQSVLHVAARKGSSQLLRLLLAAGGTAVVSYRDGSGDTPVDVAKKNRHVQALAEFRRLAGEGPGGGWGAAGRRQRSTTTGPGAVDSGDYDGL